jgi:outer membrane receptor protein involved in Fe transport
MSQRTAGNGSMNPLGAFGLNGLFRLNPEAAMVRQLETSNDQQTIGLTLTHQTRSWLTQALTIGRSNVSVETQRLAPSFSMPGDSTFDRSITPQVRQSVTYNMAVRRQLGDAIDATATVGGDYWNYKTHTVFAEQGPGDGSFGLTQLRAEDDENHGGFAQVQLGMFDRAFFTVGLRAENNTSFGENIGYKFTPRYGVSVTQEMANVSTRLRASYGRSTRPPQHEQTMPYYHTVPEYGTYQARLAAPNLLPEEQRGWEAGIDLYLGQKISVALTRYDQTVRNTIHNLHGIDSVRSLVPGPSGEYTYALQGQFVNIASIRNRGWELQGMVYVGPLSFRGAYTAAMSRIGHIPNLPEAFVQLGIIPGASMSSTPEHSGSLTVGYTTAKTTANVTVMRIGRNSSGSDSASIYREQLRLQAMRNRWRTPDNYRAIQEGYSMVDVALQREIVTGITAICNVSNLLDLYRNDLVFWSPTQGRQIMAGLRFNRR